MSTKIVLSGTACVGKSTYLEKKEREWGFPVIQGDYADHCKRHPTLTEMNGDGLLSMGYLCMVMGMQREGYIHDRGQLDPLVYECIRDIREEKKSIEQCKWELERAARIISMPNTLYIIILYNGNMDNILGRMRHRKNGIDWIDEKYVEYQNELFKILAEVMGLPIVYTCNKYGDMERELDQLIVPCLMGRGAISSVIPRGQYEDDAGMDMETTYDTRLKQGEIGYIKLKGRCLIERGYVGRLLGRSSNPRKWGIGDVGGGVIDAGYNGELSYVCIASRDVVIPRGTYIAQMIIMKHEKMVRGCKEKMITGRNTRRGEKGFGSTDN